MSEQILLERCGCRRGVDVARPRARAGLRHAGLSVCDVSLGAGSVRVLLLPPRRDCGGRGGTSQADRRGWGIAGESGESDVGQSGSGQGQGAEGRAAGRAEAVAGPGEGRGAVLPGLHAARRKAVPGAVGCSHVEGAAGLTHAPEDRRAAGGGKGRGAAAVGGQRQGRQRCRGEGRAGGDRRRG